MPRFIHLNGPPGIGKSTLAQLYVDRHPGVLNLDIDRVCQLIGGWQDNFAESVPMARSMAMAMAAVYLRGGNDVIMPQLMVRLSELRRFAAVAEDAGAGFMEIALMDSKQRSLERFDRRGANDNDPEWHRQARTIVRATGGRATLAQYYDQLDEVLRSWPDGIVVPSIEDDAPGTYRVLLDVLEN